MTVIDQAKAWLTPSTTFAKIIQFQSGAKSKMKGTGRPNSHPTTNTLFLPHLSAKLPAYKLRRAFTRPKLAINDRIMALDSMPNSSLPISGTTVCSRPIIAPTKALTTMRITN